MTQIEPIGGAASGVSGPARATAVPARDANGIGRPVERAVRPHQPTLTSELPDVHAPESPQLEPGKPVPGVIRLLEAGHFRGVADVRLRTIFFDQLSERANERTVSIVNQQAGELLAAVHDAINEHLAPITADETASASLQELEAEFDDAVQSAVRDASAAGPVDAAALETTLRNAFEALITEARELLAAPDETSVEQPASTAAPTGAEVVEVAADLNRTATQLSAPSTLADADVPESTRPADQPSPTDAAPLTPEDTDSGQALEDAIAALTTAFEEALQTLLGTVAESQRLADPGPPSGNGVAYDRFLAEYDRLRGTNDPLDVLG